MQRTSAESSIIASETHKIFAIGADQDAAVKAVIAAIPEGEWKRIETEKSPRRSIA